MNCPTTLTTPREATARSEALLCDTPFESKPLRLSPFQIECLLGMSVAQRLHQMREIVRTHEWLENHRRLKACYGNVFIWTPEMNRAFEQRMDRNLERLTQEALAAFGADEAAALLPDDLHETRQHLMATGGMGA